MVKCCRVGKSSALLGNLWVSRNDKFSDFFASSWQPGESPVPLLVLRVILFTVALLILLWSIVEGLSFYWLLYLTNWGMLLLTVTLGSGLLVSIKAVTTKFPEGTGGDLPGYMSTYWFLYNVSITLSFVISALYWLLLFDPDLKEIVGARLFWLEMSTHGFNSVLAFAELVSSRTPARFLHLYQPLGLGLWYAFFTAIYFLCGGTDGNGYPYVYEILDWREPRRSTVVVAGAAAGLIIIYSIVFTFALGRDKLTSLMFRSSSVSLPPVPPDQHMV